MKKAVFWDVAPCRSGVNRRFGGTYRLHLQGREENKKSAREASVRDVKSRLVLEINTASASSEGRGGGKSTWEISGVGWGKRPDRNGFLYMILCRGGGGGEARLKEEH
jgi:hypothetical protein